VATALPMWTRHGTCRPDVCNAACCRFLSLEVNPIYLSDPDLSTWVRLHLIELVEHNGRALARIPMPCSQLGGRGQCKLYGEPERPALCGQFPMAPASLLGLEDACTYRFEAGPALAVAHGEESPPGGHDGNRE
jgi:hypothetical protein